MSNKFKIKYILLEGVDATGKSSFKHLFNKLTGNKYCVIDRLFGSAIVYSNYNNGKNLTRQVNFSKYYEQDDIFADNGAVLLYFYADIDTIMQRQKLKNDNDITRKDIKPLLTEYNKYLSKTKIPLISINTSKLNKQEMVNYAIKQINKLGGNYYESKN